jgi:NAD(P)-dependent dehydrogenase (short-subunit alcohol dehydrogenase family)
MGKLKIKNKKYLFKRFGEKSLTGKTAVITGASGAIGKQIAVNFLTLDADIIVTYLHEAEGQGLKQSLVTDYGFSADKITMLALDLTDRASIDKFVEEIEKSGAHVKYLINNAGVIGAKAYTVNFDGTIYLSLKMTPLLNKTPGACVVFQSSLSYRFHKIDWEDIEAKKQKKRLTVYAKSKRLLNQTIIALKREWLPEYPNVTYAIAHPGCVISDIMGKPGAISKFLAKPFFHSAATASLSATAAALVRVPEDKLLGPRCFGIWGRPVERKLDKKLFDEGEIKKASAHLRAFSPYTSPV